MSVARTTCRRSTARMSCSRRNPFSRDHSPMYGDGGHCACSAPTRSMARGTESLARRSRSWRARSARFSSFWLRTRSGATRPRYLPRRAELTAPQGVDELPLARLRAARDVALLRELVQLLAVAVFEVTTGASAAGPSMRRLLAEIAPGRGGHVGDRALPLRRRLRLADVPLRCLYLLPGCHWVP